ncbi:MAG: aconitate hydratase, partial [Actinobacteria bacterium]|nr:aconitate hydratase [Actinomycetota bacterium]
SFNRNFPKRNDGSAETLAFIGSPETVVAMALSGRLDFDPTRDALEGPDGEEIRLSEPIGEEMPAGGYVEGVDVFVPPAGSGVEVEIDPASDRLQKLEPFPAWDGQDITGLPILLKAKGKCTTDHISMAGPWLRFRGHLENISGNLYMGADNAFSPNNGMGIDVVGDGEEVPLPELAKRWHEQGQEFVVFGDENFGEGSSREHAAMEPRFRGARAVIVRSFARIHETNLKKQGILPLTFAFPEDYDKVQVDDRVSILNLTELAPGSEVIVLLEHADGSDHEIPTRHTFSDEQIEWFRAGSALNMIRDRSPR